MFKLDHFCLLKKIISEFYNLLPSSIFLNISSKKKIADLLSAIDGFHKMLNVVQMFQEILDSCK